VNSHRNTHRVVVTGLGAVSSIGTDAQRFGLALRAGTVGVGRLRAHNVQGFPRELGSEVPDFEPSDWIRRQDPGSVERAGQFAIWAARQAIADAALEGQMGDGRRWALSVGTTDGHSQCMDELAQALAAHGLEALPQHIAARFPSERLSSVVADELGITGEVLTISNACAAGNYAIANAYDLVRSGEAVLCLGGGSESMSRKVYAGFHRLGAIAPERCTPFDKNRQGMIPGEGAGMVLLERLDHALERGARIYAEVLGSGFSCDAKHSTAPDRDSIVRCIRKAHANAGIAPSEVDYICAHGTGTTANDKTEAAALNEVFAGACPPVSSIKSMIGHTMGAASALGAIACIKAIEHGFLPPTVGFTEWDPECDVDCVPNVARDKVCRITQNNGYGFGGNNAVLIFAHYPCATSGVAP
jgi:3-oxoacyl-[acyl-carrier-protein] synthase II